LGIVPSIAAAQARVEVVPSIAAAYVYDDNLFYEPDAPGEEKALDAMWRITPGVTLTRESRRARVIGRYLFEAERYRDHPEVFARQQGSFRLTARPAPQVELALDAGVDSTRSPSELNLTTGLLTERRPAWRWAVSPEVAWQLQPRVELVMSYRGTVDRLAARDFDDPGSPFLVPDLLAPEGPDLLPSVATTLYSHEGRVGATYAVSGRHDFTAGYQVRRFSGDRTPLLLHVPTVGFSSRLTRYTRLTVSAGPRLGGERVGSEVAAALEQTHRRLTASATYDRTTTTAMGLAGVVDSNRISGGIAYRNPGRTEVGVRGGLFRNTFEGVTATVYQVGGHFTQTLAGPLALSASYAVNWQHGRFGRPLLPGEPEERLRRGVAAVQLVFAPTVRAVRAAEAEAEEEARRDRRDNGRLR
jgi:hypothetical protein